MLFGRLSCGTRCEKDGKAYLKEFEDVTEVLNCNKDEDMVVFFLKGHALLCFASCCSSLLYSLSLTQILLGYHLHSFSSLTFLHQSLSSFFLTCVIIFVF